MSDRQSGKARVINAFKYHYSAPSRPTSPYFLLFSYCHFHGNQTNVVAHDSVVQVGGFKREIKTERVHKEEREVSRITNRIEEKKWGNCNILLQHAQGWDLTTHLIVVSDSGHDEWDKEIANMKEKG